MQETGIIENIMRKRNLMENIASSLALSASSASHSPYNIMYGVERDAYAYSEQNLWAFFRVRASVMQPAVSRPPPHHMKAKRN